VEIAEEAGSTSGLIMAYGTLGRAWVLSQRWGDAEEALSRAVSMATERRTGLPFLPRALTGLARVHLAAGDPEAARAVLDQALELAGELGARSQELDAQLALAQLLLRVQGLAARQQIDAALERAAALIEETGARAHQPGLHEARADLARLRGDGAACQRELREARRLFVEMGATGHVERLARELAS
jgi:tetratricopeptide (TPR) repeat protein